jgi:beta-RFAP synthase
VRPEAVTVEAPARLHFGLLDPGAALGRRFGGIGASAPAVSTRLTVTLAATLHASGPDAERAARFARRFLARHGLTGGACVTIDRSIPAHCGLGSGTQLALSVARALAELHGIAATPADLARAVGRAKRSAVGTWTFAGGGFVVEGGRRAGVDDDVGPLVARLPFPAGWRYVLALPNASPGVSGTAEADAFAALRAPHERDVERVSHLVLMAMLPALADADLKTFGAALTEVQEINGRWFSAAQGGTFAPGLSTDVIALMRDAGAPGVGQSSWGPAVYAVVDGDAASAALADHIRRTFAERVLVHTGEFAAQGAVISREGPDA